MIVTKALGLVDTKETDDPNGAFQVVLSAPTLDRDGEVVDAGAFDPLPDHVPFDIDHGMSVATTVGSGTPSYDGEGRLVVDGTFASTPLAQEVRTLVSEGHIRTTSVTFMSADREEKDGVPHVVRAELLNGTFTPVPSNREAVVLSAKTLEALTDEKVGARNSGSDMELIQAAHDALTALGADCKSHADGDRKDADPEDPDEPDESPDSEPDESPADEAADESAEEPADEDEKSVMAARLGVMENAARFAFGG